jgi:hypothetical protein
MLQLQRISKISSLQKPMITTSYHKGEFVKFDWALIGGWNDVVQFIEKS